MCFFRKVGVFIDFPDYESFSKFIQKNEKKSQNRGQTKQIGSRTDKLIE